MNNNPNILIVDDTPNNLHAMRHVLKPLAIDIVEASSGQEALKQVLHNEFFMILIDVQMPEMDGFETVALIHENRQISSVPIIFVTAISMDSELVFQGYSAGAVDYLLKPINEHILLSKVKIFLDLYNQKQKISKINKKLNDFAHRVSHDLKEPLRNISTYLNLLRRGCHDKFDKQEMRYIDNTIKASENMSDLISDLLNHAENQGLEVDYEDVDLNAIAKDVLGDLQALIDEADAEIHVGALPTIDASAVHMRQVFQNLLSNAIKYRREGVPPQISVSCKIFGDEQFHRATDKNKCLIIVEDNGIGFDEKYLDKIFAPFQRLVGKDEFEGSGIGMATVKDIIELHNGSITAKSTIEAGSTFIVTLPIKRA